MGLGADVHFRPGQVSIEASCIGVHAVLDRATFARRRQLVELLVDRVIGPEDDVEIRYIIPTQPQGPHLPFGHLRLDCL